MTTMSPNQNIAKTDDAGTESDYDTSWRALAFTAVSVLGMLAGMVLIFLYGLPYA